MVGLGLTWREYLNSKKSLLGTTKRKSSRVKLFPIAISFGTSNFWQNKFWALILTCKTEFSVVCCMMRQYFLPERIGCC